MFMCDKEKKTISKRIKRIATIGQQSWNKTFVQYVTIYNYYVNSFEFFVRLYPSEM